MVTTKLVQEDALNKKELLERIRESNEYEGDPYEKEVESKSWHIGALCSAFVAMLLYFLEWFVWGENCIAMIAPVVALFAVTSLLQAIRFKSAFRIVVAVVFCALFALTAVMCVLDYGFGWR